jgi:nitroreductase
MWDPGQELLAEPMRSRRSISVFEDTHVLAPDEIRLLLTAARWAPSNGNAQPAHFVVAERGSPSHQVLTRHLTRGNSTWVPRASVVLIAGAQFAPDERGEGGYKPEYAEYDLGQAAAHLTLQACAMGLHVHQFAGFDKQAVAAELGVPAYVRLLSGIAVGVPGNPDDVSERDREREHKVRRRRPLAAMAYGDRWGKPWTGADA